MKETTNLFEYENILYEKAASFANTVKELTVGKGKRYVTMDDIKDAMCVDDHAFAQIARNALASNRFTNKLVFTNIDGKDAVGIAANKRTPQPKTPKEVADKASEKRQKGINEVEKWAQDADAEPGKMHKLLGLKADQDISTAGDPKRAAKKLVDKVGKKEAAGMINFAANLNKSDKFLQSMQSALKNIDGVNEAVVMDPFLLNI